MQQLYLVGWSADRKSVHLSRSPDHPAEFVLEADDRLRSDRSEGRPDQLAPPQQPPVGSRVVGARSPSRLSPREIQARLRNGLTVAEVAVEAGVDTSWIDRFAPPILAEQAAALGRACALTLASGRKGTSAAPLGVALARNLEERGVRPLPGFEPWSAHLHHDSTWVIRYSYRWRGRDLQAEWLADLTAGELGARNRLASDLGWLDPDLGSPRPEPAGAEEVPSDPPG